jgi:hypothetical protein
MLTRSQLRKANISEVGCDSILSLRRQFPFGGRTLFGMSSSLVVYFLLLFCTAFYMNKWAYMRMSCLNHDSCKKESNLTVL